MGKLFLMKTLNKLTLKHLTSNKKRTIVTIIGIILSTALMVGVGLLCSTMIDNSISEVKKNNGSHHATIEMLKDKLNVLNDYKIEEYKYSSVLGYSVLENSENEYKPYLEILSINSNYLKDLKLIQGRLPENNEEVVISSHIKSNAKVELYVDDYITLNIGQRFDPTTNLLLDEQSFVVGEKLINTFLKQYKIVGIVDRSNLEDYSNPGYNIFTTNDDQETLKVYLTYKKVKDTYKNSNAIASDLGYEPRLESFYQEVKYNDTLLYLHGVTVYDNLFNTIGSFLAIILSLISIACIIVIYNSFAISVMERKKQFGLFSSIGATKKQLKYTVFFEAFVVGFIGIFLGIISSLAGIGIVITIVNHLLPDMFGEPLRLIVYPLFIIIPVIFMIVTIVISAYLPSKMASRISPIEAIRQNDDIKIKGKKVKSPKIIQRLFKTEGDIAYKNMKRNKKKYRITIISLFISIVLFISFTSIVNYGLETTYDYVQMPAYDFNINFSINSDEDLTEIENTIKGYEHKKYFSYQRIDLHSQGNLERYFSEEFKNNQERQSYDYFDIVINLLDSKSYEEYKRQIGLKEDKVILVNYYETILYDQNSRKQVKINPFNDVTSLNFKIHSYKEDNFNKDLIFENVYTTNLIPDGIIALDPSYCINLIVSKDLFDSLALEYADYKYINIGLTANDYTDLTKYLDQLDDSGDYSMYYFNVKEQMKMVSNIILVIKILLYGFISLVTLIGVTSVLNTINTSISLRKKEFAMLRSVGLTPAGFNKMLFFESLFFGLKSLLYALPVSLLITYLLHRSATGIVSYQSMIIPWDSIIISIVGVFVVIMISMWYSTTKIKHENILEAIREENI